MGKRTHIAIPLQIAFLVAVLFVVVWLHVHFMYKRLV